ncbi:MAG: 23S rRNA (guanosine(2251)-2'-O)-methyltransferase RlmB [Clostridiales bacterium]|nr:23S rRNA (guanosine(2251)-2'-O)-methyltransferase RlmB [Clostridiales bacterium]
MAQNSFRREEEIIAGRNAVMEALRSGRAIDSLLLAKGNRTGALGAIAAKAKAQGVAVKEVDGKKLDHLCAGAPHQGVVAMAAAHEYARVEDILALAESRGEPPFLIIADELEDPHNLGAIIRTAECAGAHGVVIPRRRAAGLTYTVGKASAGAVEYLPVARVTNIAAAIDDLKKRGVWVYGTDLCGENWCQTDLTGAIALVIGNEGAGISRLVKEKCDGMLTLPMLGQISSLNASVAAGVVMYEIARQRLGLTAR